MVNQLCEFFTDYNTHAAAHEIEIHHRDHCRPSFDFGDAGHDRIISSAGLSGCLQPLRVRTNIDEFERVSNRQVSKKFTPTAAVDGNSETLLNGQAQMISAFRAYVQITLDFFAERDLFATLALNPDVGSTSLLARNTVVRSRRLSVSFGDGRRRASACPRFPGNSFGLLHLLFRLKQSWILSRRLKSH